MCVSGECNEESQNWSLTKVKNANETTTDDGEARSDQTQKRKASFFSLLLVVLSFPLSLMDESIGFGLVKFISALARSVQ